MIADNDFWQHLRTQIQEIIIHNSKTHVAQPCLPPMRI